MKFDREQFFDSYREQFGRLAQEQVDGLNNLLRGFESVAVWKDLRHISYALATVKHETANTFQPITEYGSENYFRKYDGRADLGNTQRGDGARFKGRGFVQLTGRRNYALFSQLLGLDLINNPNLALNPDTAFQIMSLGMFRGYYTGKKFSDYINDSKCDYVNARRIINALDKANLIASYAEKFYSILVKSQIREATPENVSAIIDSNRFEPSVQNNPSAPSNPLVVQPNTTLPQNVPTRTAQTISGESTPATDGGANQLPPDSPTQIAENITNVNTDTVPPDFTPETKTQLAPEKENSTATQTKITIGGFTVPAFLVAIWSAVQQFISSGFVSAQQVGEAVLNFITNNTKYFLILIGLIIVGMMLKKFYKQFTMWLQMWINTDPKRHDVEVVKQ